MSLNLRSIWPPGGWYMTNHTSSKGYFFHYSGNGPTNQLSACLLNYTFSGLLIRISVMYSLITKQTYSKD